MKDGEVKEQGLVAEIFNHPKSQVAKELISRDTGADVEHVVTKPEIQSGEKIRIVFSENSAFEPVIANIFRSIPFLILLILLIPLTIRPIKGMAAMVRGTMVAVVP